MNLTLRQAVPADIPVLRALIDAFQTPMAFKQWCQQELSDSAQRFFYQLLHVSKPERYRGAM